MFSSHFWVTDADSCQLEYQTDNNYDDGRNKLASVRVQLSDENIDRSAESSIEALVFREIGKHLQVNCLHVIEENDVKYDQDDLSYFLDYA